MVQPLTLLSHFGYCKVNPQNLHIPNSREKQMESVSAAFLLLTRSGKQPVVGKCGKFDSETEVKASGLYKELEEQAAP